MPPLHILHCLRAPVGGLFRHVYDLAEEQAAMGHHVGVLCDSSTGDRLTAERLARIEAVATLGVHRTAMSRVVSHTDPTALRCARRLARELGCDVVHGHGAKGGVYARLAVRSNRRVGLDTYSFYTPHGGTLNYRPGSFASRAFLAIEKRLLGITDGLCFESQYAADKFDKLVGKPACTVGVIPNGVRPSEFTPHVPRSDASDFVFLGEIREVKGVDLLVDAIAALKESHGATATVVGDGPLRETMIARAEEKGVAALMRWPGALPADVAFTHGRNFVMPSRSESFPYVVLEAAAQGIPALLTNVGGVAEMTEPGDRFLIVGGALPPLIEAMREALDAPRALGERTLAFRERVRTAFSTAGMAASIVVVYRTSIKGDATGLNAAA
ncbi:MAG: glycosyltransferase family 4 protein [Pseudomonadota bacterium]